MTAPLSPGDPRLLPLRDGLASTALEGEVAARAYLAPTPLACAAPAAALRGAPDAAARRLDELVFGEGFDALRVEGGWVWGQAQRDGYVGWLRAEELAPSPGPATHRLAALRAYAFAEPDIKAAPSGPYSLGALLAVDGREGRFLHAPGAGWFADAHLAEVEAGFEADWAGVALRFLGAPYLWGGRTSLGLDCSGLVQQALYACGRACPRDSDQQQALGPQVGREALRRGDLAFWRGHVGVMLDADALLHANAHHMAVAIEPLDAACTRIAAAAGGEASFRRP